MIRFDVATAQRIVFGRGSASGLAAIVREFGSRPLIVTGAHPARYAHLNLAGEVFSVVGEPTVPMVRDGVACARKAGCDAVVSIGGGSAIDAGKAIAILAANSGEPLDYLEVVGRGGAFERPGLPYIAVPTTAGTGSEVTRNAVLGSPEHGVKASLRSPWMLARVALIDPELTFGLPRDITASTGLDALTQLIEPYVSMRANAMTDLFCLDGIARIAASLEGALRDEADARESMAFASLLGGLSLANAGLGVVHGFAAPIGGMTGAAHGEVCAAILPHGMRANIRALNERDPARLERFRRVARILAASDDPQAAVARVEELCAIAGVRRLSQLGVTAAMVPQLVAKAAQASSMKANPIVLTSGELTRVLEDSL